MHDSVVEIILDKTRKSLRIRAAEGHKVWISDQSGLKFETVRDDWAPINGRNILHFGPQNRSHRFAYFENPMKVK